MTALNEDNSKTAIFLAREIFFMHENSVVSSFYKDDCLLQ